MANQVNFEEVENNWWDSEIDTVCYNDDTEVGRLSNALIKIFDFQSCCELEEAHDIIETCTIPDKHIVNAWLALRLYLPHPVFINTFKELLEIITDENNQNNPLYHLNLAKAAGLNVPERLNVVWLNFHESVLRVEAEYKDNRYQAFFKNDVDRTEAWKRIIKYPVGLSCFAYDPDSTSSKKHRVGTALHAFKHTEMKDVHLYEVGMTKEKNAWNKGVDERWNPALGDAGFRDCRCAVDVDNKDVIKRWYPDLGEDDTPPEEDRREISHKIVRELREQFYKMTGEKITPLSYIEMQADYNKKGEYTKFSRHFVLTFTKWVGKGAASWKAISESDLFDPMVFGATAYRMIGQSKRKKKPEKQRKLTIIAPDDMKVRILDEPLAFYYFVLSKRERNKFENQTVYERTEVEKRRKVKIPGKTTITSTKVNEDMTKAFEKGKEMCLFVEGSVANGYTGESLRITRPHGTACPFGCNNHKSNKNSTITPALAPYQYTVRCFGSKCKGKTKTIDLTPITPFATDKVWLEKTVKRISKILMNKIAWYEKKEDSESKETPYVLVVKNKGYMFTNGTKTVHIGVESCNFGIHNFKTPSLVKYALFNHEFVPLEKLLDAKPNDHKDTHPKPTFQNNVFTCGKYAPGMKFGLRNDVQDTPERGDKRGHTIIVKGHETEKNKMGKINYIYTLVSQLGMGSGKTWATAEHIKDAAYDKVVVISPRISQGDSVLELFNDTFNLGFVGYRDGDGDKLCVQIDSLMKKCGKNGRMNLPQVVVIDEMMTVLEHFSAETFKNARNVFDFFKMLCTSVDKLIVLDADIEQDDRVYKFLTEECMRKDIVTVRSNQFTDPNTYYEMAAGDDVLERIVYLLQKNMKVVIPSNSATFIKYIEEKLRRLMPDKKGIAIYNEPGHTFDNLSIDGKKSRPFRPNEDTKHIDWFAYSPSLSPGVSITTPFDIEVAHAMASDLTAGVRYWGQMLRRCRVINTGIILFKIETVGCKNLSLKRQDVIDEIQAGRNLLSDAQFVEQKWVNGACIIRDEGYNRNFIDNEIEKRKCKIFRSEFIRRKKKEGGAFYYLQYDESTKEKATANKKERKEIKKKQREIKLRSKASAPKLTQQEYNEYKAINDPKAYLKLLKKQNIIVFTKFHGANGLDTLKNAKWRYEYCERHGLDHEADITDYVLKYNKKVDYDERPRLFLNMFMPFDILFQGHEFKDYRIIIKIFHELIRIGGWNDITDDRIFSKANGATIDLKAAKNLQEMLKTMPGLETELKVKKAETVEQFFKCAMNQMGKKLGLGTKLVVYNGDKQKRSLREIKEGQQDDSAMNEMLERAYMRWRCNDWYKDFIDEKIFKTRTDKWKDIMKK